MRFVAEESEKVKAELEQMNKALSTELEEVKTTLSQTEETLSTTTEQKNIYYELMSKSASSLMSTVKGLMKVLTEVPSVRKAPKRRSFTQEERNELTLSDCFSVSGTGSGQI